MKTIAILGCGNIGNIVAGHTTTFEVVAVHDRIAERREKLASRTGAVDCPDFSTLLGQEFDLLLECASADAVRRLVPDALKKGQDAVVLSVGALADQGLYAELESAARARGTRLLVPSGAVMGLDALKIGRISPFRRLLLRTTKPAAALGCEAQEKTCLFRGRAGEAIERFPRNINVATSISLAAGRECEVEIWADPEASGNRHQIFAEGEFGHAEISVDNVPSPDNPRTSYLAALSVLALIEDYDSPIKVGT
jgi:aspartate dehydrogenase